MPGTGSIRSCRNSRRCRRCEARLRTDQSQKITAATSSGRRGPTRRKPGRSLPVAADEVRLHSACDRREIRSKARGDRSQSSILSLTPRTPPIVASIKASIRDLSGGARMLSRDDRHRMSPGCVASRRAVLRGLASAGSLLTLGGSLGGCATALSSAGQAAHHRCPAPSQSSGKGPATPAAMRAETTRKWPSP
jgi:hypothetical protein